MKHSLTILLLGICLTCFAQRYDVDYNGDSETVSFGDSTLDVNIIEFYPNSILLEHEGQWMYLSKNEVTHLELIQGKKYKNGTHFGEYIEKGGSHLIVGITTVIIGSVLAVGIGSSTENYRVPIVLGGITTAIGLGFSYSGYSKLIKGGKRMRAIEL